MLPSPTLPHLDFPRDAYFADAMGAAHASPEMGHAEREEGGRVSVAAREEHADYDRQPRLLNINVRAHPLSLLSSVDFDFILQVPNE